MVVFKGRNLTVEYHAEVQNELEEADHRDSISVK